MRSPQNLLLHLLTLTPLTTADLFGFGGSSGWPDETNDTVFNGKTVPRPTYLKGDNFDDSIATGYHLVEFFSPYCHHCEAFAPVWKTLYEYYYTQDPVPQTPDGEEDDLNSFTRFYDFHFAKVDCVASADLCSKKAVHSFPTIRFYKDGEVIKEAIGQKDLKFMSEGVEEVLERIRPGSRPKEGPSLPEVGATAAPPVAANVPLPTPTTTTSTGSNNDAHPTHLPATRIDTHPHGTPNPYGKSTPLSAEYFQRLVTMTRDPWFIKFYTPWCAHCQAMAPNWQGMARQMQGQLNVGEVNCDAEKRLCKDVKVRGYPTLLFFRGGERIEYDGLRGLGDLISYANKAVAVCEGVKDVTAAEFEEMEKQEEVIFVYFYDHATTSEDFAALERLPMSLIGHAKLVMTSDPEMAERFSISTWPRFIVSRDGKASYYQPLSPGAMRDTRRVLGWMQKNWLPIVPELTAANAHEIMDKKYVVLGILSRDRPDEFLSAKREIKNAALEWIDKQANALKLELQELRDAKQLRLEEAEDRNDQGALRRAKSIRINIDDILRERKDVGFAWVDGVFWERWTKTTFGVSVVNGGEKVVVNDEDGKRYWDNTMTGNHIVPSRTSILETLPRIVANPPKIASKTKLTALGHLWWMLRGQVWRHPIVSAALAVVGLVGLWWWRGAMLLSGGAGPGGFGWWGRDKGYGYFKVGMEKGGPMDGLLGVGGGIGLGGGGGGGGGGVGKKD